MLESPDQRFFEAACGYLQLAMPLEANEELENIDPFNRTAPEILALRLAIYGGLEKWELMVEIAKRLTEFQPDNPEWLVSLAYANAASNLNRSSERDSDRSRAYPCAVEFRKRVVSHLSRPGQRLAASSGYDSFRRWRFVTRRNVRVV